MKYKIGSFQLQDVQGDTNKTLGIIVASLSEADDDGLDIVCFPECYLQGYTLDLAETEKRAIDLASVQFETVLAQLSPYKTVSVIGLIERENDSFFNTAVVIKEGKLLGKYRKIRLFETNFQPGVDYPVFSVGGLKFGINICYDARFSGGAARLAEQGAQIIFYPLNNRLPTEKAIKYRDKHMPNLIARAQEAGCLVVSSDVIAQDETTIGYGCTAIVSADGQVLGKVAEFTTGMVAVEV